MAPDGRISAGRFGRVGVLRVGMGRSRRGYDGGKGGGLRPGGVCMGERENAASESGRENANKRAFS